MSLSLGFFIRQSRAIFLGCQALLVIVILLLAPSPTGAVQLSQVRLLSSGLDGLTFEFLSGDLSITDQASGESDGTYQVVRLAGCQLDVRPGIPMVPMRSVNIGVPAQGSVSFSVLEDEFTDREGLFLAPGPKLYRTADSKTALYDEIYQPAADVYGRNAFFPDVPCRTDGEMFLRHQRVLPVVIFPVQWNPASRTLRLHHRLVVRVRFSSPPQETQRPPAPDPFRKIYPMVLLNEEQARQWRQRPTPLVKTTLQSEDPFSISDDWFRIGVRQQGLVCLTGGQLSQAGLNLSDVDPSTIRMYHMGRKILPRQLGNPPVMEEIPISVSGSADGRFDSQDEVFFYATDLSGWDEMSQAGYGEYSNPYTNLNIYWLTYGVGVGRRWNSRPGAPEATDYVPARRYRACVHQERDFLNLDYTGLTWYWDSMTDHFAETVEYVLTVSDVQESSCQLKVRVKGIYYRPNGSVPSSIPHHVYIYLNEDADPVIERLWFGDLVITAEEPSSGLREGENIIKVTLPRAESEWDHILFDWFEIEYWRGYGVVEDQLYFTSPDTTGTIQYDLEGFSADLIRLLDISDPWAPVEISGGAVIAQDQVNTLRFQDVLPAGQSRQYYAATSEAYQTPVSIERRIPADLRGTGGDVVMITPQSLRQSLEPLAQMHREEGLHVVVATIEDVYDRFAWGLADATAIRDYLWHLYHLEEGSIPAYVLLFGDGNFDYKNNSGAGGGNLIPPYENGDLCTDDWFVRLDGDYLADMMIGRLPARSVNEADIMVGKIVDYVRGPLFGPWRNRVMIVSDDETADNGKGNELFHTRDSEDLAQHYIPTSYDQHKVYLMQYPMDWSNKKPQAQQAVIDGFNEGMLWVNWIGHGNFDVWAHEDAFRASNDIPKLANGRRLPMVYSASCDVGRFDHTLNESMCEEFLRVHGKGAVATIGATRSCFATPNAELNKEVLLLALSQEGLTLGQSLFGAKLSRPNSYSNDQKYALFGDPCMALGKPELQSRSVTMSCDTLRALDHVTILGQVIENQAVDTTFSGTAFVRVFDSARPTSYVTEVGSQVNYVLPGAAIFRGNSLVQEGRFEASFVVPKDISYGGQQARISAYLDNGQRDGLAYRDSLLVGGTVTAVADTQGPSITLSIAGQQFISGDFAPSDPVIVAHLEDENGINITGEVGHWIILLVDDGDQRINVTDYFQYDPGSYQRGSLEHTLSGLSPGPHQVTMKAWDNFNNFSTAAVEFQVSSEIELVLRDVLNCPNPFDPRSESTSFTYQLSRPADVTIKIYTVAGRLIRTIQEGGQPSGYHQSRPWNGSDQDGDDIANGVYLYKIIARADEKRAEAYGKVVVMR